MEALVKAEILQYPLASRSELVPAGALEAVGERGVLRDDLRVTRVELLLYFIKPLLIRDKIRK